MNNSETNLQAASLSSNNPAPSWSSATGPLTISMTNDYLFRALLQRNNNVLKGLICSLLHLAPEDIVSVVITNPIELGKAIDDKTFILDINVTLNDNTLINLEMQVINEYNWTDRSLSYLCRSFDSLKAGEAYQSVRPVIQIGLLNFTLFPEHPEFYATYQFLNVKNYTLYSDKLRLSVLDLTHIDLATEEDKRYQLDYWAALFKSTTWEELNMLAKSNEYIGEASATIYQLSQEEQVRQQCDAREDYYRTQRGIQQMMEKQMARLVEQENRIREQDSILKKQGSMLNERNSILKERDSMIKERDSMIHEQDSMLKEQDSMLKERDSMIHEQDSMLKEQDSMLKERDSMIHEQDSMLKEQASMLKEQSAAINQLTAENESLLAWARAHGYKQ